MATRYHIYRNGGGGLDDPVDYSTPIADTDQLQVDTPALTAPGDYLLAVRAYDDVSGLEESNAEPIRLRLDASGNDVTGLPNALTDLDARARSGGDVLVSWTYNPEGQGGAPTSFKVWATLGGAVNYSDPVAATVSYDRLTRSYSTTLSGLTAGSAYAIGARASNSTGDETSTTSVSVTPSNTGPDQVESLAATATGVA